MWQLFRTRKSNYAWICLFIGSWCKCVSVINTCHKHQAVQTSLVPKMRPAAVITPGPVRTVKPHKTLLVEKANKSLVRYSGDHLSHQFSNKRMQTPAVRNCWGLLLLLLSVPGSHQGNACRFRIHVTRVSTEPSPCSKGTQACYGHQALKNSNPRLLRYTPPPQRSFDNSLEKKKCFPVARQEARTKPREKHTVSFVKSRLVTNSISSGGFIHTGPVVPQSDRFSRKTVQTIRKKTPEAIKQQRSVPGRTMGGRFGLASGSALNFWQPTCWRLKACRLAFSRWINNTCSYLLLGCSLWCLWCTGEGGGGVVVTFQTNHCVLQFLCNSDSIVVDLHCGLTPDRLSYAWIW